MKKILMYVLIAILIIIGLVYIVFRFFLSMSYSEEEIRERFVGMDKEPIYHTYDVRGNDMHYAEIGESHLPVVLFIHGSPGSWDAFVSYFADSVLLKNCRMISVDRIGYGKSSPGKAESSLNRQVAYLYPIIQQISDSVPLIIVGHSYGGPIAYRMAMMYPNRVSGMLILAGLADPAHEYRPGILGPMRSKPLRWLFPPDLDVSNREIFPLKEELEKMKSEWANIRAETVIVQGKKDMLVAYQHAKFAEEQLVHLSPQMVYLPEANHFLPWTHYDLVKEQIMLLIEKVE